MCTQPIVVIVHDIFLHRRQALTKPEYTDNVTKRKPKPMEQYVPSVIYYNMWTVNCQITSKCDNAARSELLFTLCRVTVMACSDVSGSPVDEQTFIQVRVQWRWQLITISNIPSPPPQLSFQVIHTARDDSCGGGLGMRLGCNGGLFSVCQFPHTMLKWEVDQPSGKLTDRSSAGQWSVVTSTVLLGLAWAESVCNHDKEVCMLWRRFNTCCGGG